MNLTDMLDFIIEPLDALLTLIHDNLGVSWAISIIILTIIVRIVLIPLTVKQYTSMRAMQKLQPKIKELQAKYKEDKQKLNEEMMKFYKENKVNPFGSCLPLLLQMPIFMALYIMLSNKVFPEGDSLAFLWIDSIKDPDKILVFVYMATQLFSSLLMSATVDKSQRMIMILMPLGLGVFFLINPFPSGVLLYWVTTNVWTIGQQLIVKQIIQAKEGALEPETVPAIAPQKSKKVPQKAKKTGGKGGGKQKK
ncbi:MAG: YidC/Oxa1 family membrane protein insertase [Thermoleophilia bacterium]